MMTLASVLAPEAEAASTGSLKPKSAAVKVRLPSSRMVMVLLAPRGASLTGVPVMFLVPVTMPPEPSSTLVAMVKLPLKLAWPARS